MYKFLDYSGSAVSLRIEVVKYHHRLPEYTGSFTADATNRFAHLVLSLWNEVKDLAEQRENDIQTTVLTDL